VAQSYQCLPHKVKRPAVCALDFGPQSAVGFVVQTVREREMDG
jgi:hypothetical protein